MGKLVFLSFLVFVSQSAQAASFFCKSEPNYGTWVVAKDQAYPSRLPVSQVVVIEARQPVIDMEGSYESPQSDLFQTHLFKMKSNGKEAKLTVAPYQSPFGCGRGGCKKSDDFFSPQFAGKFQGQLEFNDQIVELSCDKI